MQWIGPVLSLLDKIMDRTPNYEQSKKEQYFKIKKKLLEEAKKPDHIKNDGIIDDLSDELLIFVESFSEEIATKGVL